MRKNLFTLGIVSMLCVSSTICLDLHLKDNPFSNFVHDVKDKLTGTRHDTKKPENIVKTSPQQPKSQQSKPSSVPQTCQTNDYLVKQADFPYWSTDLTANPFPCMYAGTFDTSTTPEMKHNLFFWMIKNTQLDTTVKSPELIIWLNGGPGATSMNGLFLENGPLQVSGGVSADQDDYQVSLRKGSWGDLADILYLDNPVGTGFSYGDSYVSSIEDAAREFVLFFDQFLRTFQEYQSDSGRSITLAGESFGGKYLAAYSKFLDDHLNTNDIKFNVRNIIMGNPLISPPIQRLMTHQVAQALGVVDENNLEQIHTLNKNCEETLSNGDTWSLANDKCSQVLDYIQDIGGDLFSYDARIFTADYQAISKIYEGFLTSSKQAAQLYKAIHIDKSTKVPIFSKKSKQVEAAFNEIAMLDSSYYIDQILSIGYHLLIYAGEWDQRDGPGTIESWLKQSRQMQLRDSPIWEQPKQIYYVKTGDNEYQVGGYYRRDTTTRVTVLVMPKAGHFAPMNQLATTTSFINDFVVFPGTLNCHKDKPEDCLTAPIMCKYMNNDGDGGAHGATHGKCGDNGIMTCDLGYYSGDCSEQAELLSASYSKQFVTNGTQWKYFYYKNGLLQNLYHEFTLSSAFPMDIYISSGWQSDPNEFDYELAFKKQNYIKISSKQFPSLDTFVAAVKINAVEHYSTTYHVNTLYSRFDVKVDSKIAQDILHKEEENKFTLLEESQEVMESETQFEGMINSEVSFEHNSQMSGDHENKEYLEGQRQWRHHQKEGEKDIKKRQNHKDHRKQNEQKHKSKSSNTEPPHKGFFGRMFEKVKNFFQNISISLPQFVILTVIFMLLCVYRVQLQTQKDVEDLEIQKEKSQDVSQNNQQLLESKLSPENEKASNGIN
eukprot:403369927